MAYVRRHWLKSVLYGLVIILGLAIFLTPTLFSESAPEAAQAQAIELQPIPVPVHASAEAAAGAGSDEPRPRGDGLRRRVRRAAS